MNNQCPNCSSSFTEKTKFCKICGSNLQKEVIENPTCPLCNEVFSSDIKFCIQDGTLLVHPDKLIPKCVVCKKAYTNGTKFCPNDGGKIELENKLAPLKTTPQIPIIEPVKQIFQEQPVYKNKPSNSYNKAPTGKRFLAYILDIFFAFLLFLPSLFFLFGSIASYVNNDYYDVNARNLNFGLLLLLLPFWYALVKDGMGQGQSWGKSALDLMVININTNEPCTKWNSTGRNILFSIICGIPYLGYLIEIIMVFANPEGRKLSDLGAGTQVIEVKEYKNN
ncbi:Uncharacterized membrane protein YckC, RDD family [Flavobacterium gillisiae]|uniref:Uncharacterized membrane protein YckC, RDD family n=1 Tax=Flavobacterium gillisiae TaxID=150146 RepID=A0A1H4GC61_9FLAO|nr:RDD family protein [Flavobacterium gillisiae]SEB06488.1 Uncharacterized membrane protein YckC, RDD family [Flavobacterium gillisiae]